MTELERAQKTCDVLNYGLCGVDGRMVTPMARECLLTMQEVWKRERERLEATEKQATPHLTNREALADLDERFRRLMDRMSRLLTIVKSDEAKIDRLERRSVDLGANLETNWGHANKKINRLAVAVEKLQAADGDGLRERHDDLFADFLAHNHDFETVEVSEKRKTVKLTGPRLTKAMGSVAAKTQAVETQAVDIDEVTYRTLETNNRFLEIGARLDGFHARIERLTTAVDMAFDRRRELRQNLIAHKHGATGECYIPGPFDTEGEPCTDAIPTKS